MTNAVSLASEIVAFANSGGEKLFIGVADDGSIEALDANDVHRINQLIGNAAYNQIRPAINPVTENVPAANGIVIVVTIPDGIVKPYGDSSEAIWVKSGSDKRKVTAREKCSECFKPRSSYTVMTFPLPDHPLPT